MPRTQSSLRLAALGVLAMLGLASATTFAQMGEPTSPNAQTPPEGGQGGPGGPGGPGGNRGPGMRGGGGPGAAILGENFGTTVRPLPRNQAEASGVKPGVGLVVESVKADSLAAKGGLQQGDVVVKLADQWVINPAQLGTLLSIQDAGSSVKLTVRRGSENVELAYTIDQAAKDAMTKALDAAPTGGPRGGPGGGGPRGERGPGGGGRDGDRPAPAEGGGMNP